MEYELIRFKDEEGEMNFGLHNMDKETVVCLCCGGTFDPNEIEIVKRYSVSTIGNALKEYFGED